AAPLEEGVAPRSHVGRRLAAGAAVAPQVPVGALFADLLGGAALVVAVAELDQEIGRLGAITEPRERRGVEGAPKGAREDATEPVRLEQRLESTGLLLAVGRQPDVGGARVLQRLRPLRLAVPNHPDVHGSVPSAPR